MSNREIDLSKPTLIGLSYLLRNDALWPIGFDWDFGTRENCALGLASEYWGLEMMVSGSKFASDTFGMKLNDTLDVFYGRGDWSPKLETTEFVRFFWGAPANCRKITPEMVADAIDDYLLRRVVNHPLPKMTAVAA